MTVRESEWTPEDVAELVAARRRAGEKRSPTGYLLSEVFDPANADAFYVKRNEQGIPLPHRDPSVKALHQAQDDYFKAFPAAKGDPSYVWTVLRRDG